MDAAYMSPDELRALADQKEQEAKPLKHATLKHDLYRFDSDSGFPYGTIRLAIPDKFKHHWLYTKEERDEILEIFKSQIEENFELTLKKDAKFMCFSYEGTEQWEDVEFNEVEADDTWAKTHLTNIKKL